VGYNTFYSCIPLSDRSMVFIEHFLNVLIPIAEDVYQDFFQRPAIQEIIRDQEINLIVFEPNLEEILQWIN
jgi:hypothetical protein